VEMSLIGQGIIPPEDILPSIRDLKAMCHLYSSLVSKTLISLVSMNSVLLQSWFIQQLVALRGSAAEASAEQETIGSPVSDAPLPLSKQSEENLQLSLGTKAAA
jgi:hypothetical protein